MKHDPPTPLKVESPWSDELAELSEHGPSSESLARVGAAVEAEITGASPPSGGSGGARGAGGASTALKVGLPLIAAGALVFWAATQSSGDAPSEEAPAPGVAPPRSSSVAVGPEAHPDSAPPPAPAPESERIEPPVPATVPAPRPEPRPATRVVAPPSPSPPPSSPAAPAVTPPVPPAPPASSTPSASSLKEQLELFNRARAAAAAGKHATALLALDELSRRHRGSPFEPEAQLLRVDVLARSGATRKAQDLVASLLKDPRLRGKRAELHRLDGDLWLERGDCKRAVVAWTAALDAGLSGSKAQRAREAKKRCAGRAP